MNNWFSKHVDTVVVLTAIMSSILWMNGKFSDIEKEIFRIDKEISVIKAILIVRHILPQDLAISEAKE